MAYDHGRQQIQMLTTGGLNLLNTVATTSVKRWRHVVGVDQVVRAVGVINTTTKTGALSISWRNTATAGASSASGTEFARTTTATTNQKGKATVRKGLNVTASAGSEIVAQVRTAVSGAFIAAFVYVEPRPVDVLNKTRVTTVTT
jgi:hypothetical protein